MLRCFFSFSQDTISETKEKKARIDLIAGGYYKLFMGERYIEPTKSNSGDDFSLHQYERFTKSPTSGFQVGISFSYKLYKKFFLKTGLIFCNRKMIYENKMDTVIKYGYFPFAYTNTRNVHNVLKYEYHYNNIEIPIMLSCRIKKTSLSAGIRLAILSFYTEKYTYVVNQFPQSPQYITSDKTIKSVEMPLMIYPSMQVNYDFQIHNLILSPFLEVDFGSKKSFYFQGGLAFSLRSISQNFKK